METAQQPLAGVKVVEFSTMITASLATMMFAQQGAEVIKVEPPGIGDPMRWLGSRKESISGLFHNCNRAKRSITLDLKDTDDVAVAREICLDSDIVIHNYRPGVMSRLGLDSDSLMAEKPSLIYCAITGFGREGPMAKRPAYDHVMQAMSGFMSVQGRPGGVAYMKTLLCDKITAYTAAQAITAALFARERSGEGARIDLSMLASGLAFLWPDGAMHLTLMDNDVTQAAPLSDYYGLPLKTKDGAVSHAAMTDDHWHVIFDLVGLPHLKEDAKYQGADNRGANMAELITMVAAAGENLTTQEMMDGLTAGDVPAAPCMTLEELKTNEQVIAIGAFEEEEHPLLGPTHSIRSPIHFGGKKLPANTTSPILGEHSEAIRAELNQKDA